MANAKAAADWSFSLFDDTLEGILDWYEGWSQCKA